MLLPILTYFNFFVNTWFQQDVPDPSNPLTWIIALLGTGGIGYLVKLGLANWINGKNKEFEARLAQQNRTFEAQLEQQKQEATERLKRQQIEFDTQLEAARAALDERAKDLEFKRQQTDAAAASDQAENVAVWGQMTQLQTQALHQNAMLIEYVIGRQDEQMGVIAGEVRNLIQEIKVLSEAIRSIVHEVRSLRTNEGLIVSEILARADKSKANSDGILWVQERILELQDRQAIIQSQIDLALRKSETG